MKKEDYEAAELLLQQMRKKEYELKKQKNAQNDQFAGYLLPTLKK